MAGAAILGAVYAAAMGGHLEGSGNKVLIYALICAVGALISMVGDLAASAIKRNHDIKDYGKLIPGHGGVLDRFDSVIFTAPVIYFLALLLCGIGRRNHTDEKHSSIRFYRFHWHPDAGSGSEPIQKILKVTALAAGRNIRLLEEQIRRVSSAAGSSLCGKKRHAELLRTAVADLDVKMLQRHGRPD